MLLRKNDKNIGVKCDITGKNVFKKFTYYSGEIKRIVVKSSIKATLPGEVELDMDISEDGLATLLNRAKKHLKTLEPVGTIKCDLSGKVMAGDFDYWIFRIAQVDVDVDNEKQPMTVRRNVLDFRICKEIFDELEKTRKRTRADASKTKAQ